MNKVKIQLLLASIVCVFLFEACANIAMPNGGPKDTLPPKVKSEVPANETKNFTSNSVVISFDEYVNLKEPNEQIIISPPLAKKPDITIKGKSIVVKLNDSLMKNTTYHINFGSSIVDVNEANVLDGLVYAFSTGDVIDTLSLAGSVVNAFDKKKQKGLLVQLYRNEGFYDSLPAKKKPLYFGKTNDKGAYRIQNIAAGKYRLLVLKDENANYLYDQPSEAVGFDNGIIDIKENTERDYSIFVAENQKQFIKSKKLIAKKMGLTVSYNKPCKEPVLKFYKPNQKHITYSTEVLGKKDSVIFWFKNPIQPDTIDGIIELGQYRDTVHFYTAKRAENNKKAPFMLETNVINSELPFFSALQLHTESPLLELDTTKMILKENAQSIRYKMEVDSVARLVSIRTKWKYDEQYILQLYPGAFKNRGKKTNDTLEVKFKIQNPESFGNLHIQLKNYAPQTNYLLQLWDDQKMIEQRAVSDLHKKIVFEHLPPAKYSLKMVIDSNNDKHWTTGDYWKHIQPEEIIICPEVSEVRANWDVNIDWDLGVK